MNRRNSVILSAALLSISVVNAARSLAAALNVSANTNLTATTSYQGGLWSVGTITFSDGVTITLAGPPQTHTFTLGGNNAFAHKFTTPGAASIRVINEGTFSLTNGQRGAWEPTVSSSGEVVFENRGVFEATFDNVLSGGNGQIYTINTTIDPIFLNTGTIRYSGTSQFKSEGNDLRLINSNGTVEVSGGGSILWAASDLSPMVTNACYNGTFVLTNGTFVIGQGWEHFTGYATGDAVRLGGAFYSIAETTVVAVTGEGIDLNNSWFDMNGNVLEHAANGIVHNRSALRGVKGSGTFRNRGEWHHRPPNAWSSNSKRWTMGATVFENLGTFQVHSTEGGTWAEGTGPATFHNGPGGLLLKTNTTVFFFSGTTPANGSVFRNEGRVEVAQGSFLWTATRWIIDGRTVSNGVLHEGTWQATRGGDITFPGSVDMIDTINTNAAVILGEAGSGLNKISEAGLTNVFGTFGLREGRGWTTTGALVTDGSTRLQFGLQDPGSNPLLTLGEDTSLQATIDVADHAGLLISSNYTVIEMASGKILTDGGIQPGTVASSKEFIVQVIVTPGADGKVVVKVKEPPRGSVLTFR